MLHPRIPRSVLHTARTEHDGLPLATVDGVYPRDLDGHLFCVAPAGTFRPDARSRRTTLMVGDGLVCRFDFRKDGVALTTRLARTHDFVADQITSEDSALDALRFVDAGLVRIGALGTRNFANTAFVPLGRDGAPTRMLLTYDAGRPVEIDPETLAVLGPIGGRGEWRAEALPNFEFPIVLSPAHPAWDRRTGELFTVNYGRGVGNFAATVPLVYLIERMPDVLERALDSVAQIAGVDRAYRVILKHLERISTRIDRRVEAWIDRYFPSIPDTFTDLVRWDGSGSLERFRLVLPDGREVSIEQSIHQVAVTREHVVVLETGYKIGFQSAFNDPIEHTDVIERLIRTLVTRPQLPSTIFYVVPRAALADPSRLPVGDDGVRRVRCQRVEIPLECDHFLADYEEQDGRLVVHVAHSPATDLSEWIRPYDESAYGVELAAGLHGMLAVGAMDVGRFGRYEIEAATGAVRSARTYYDDHRTWALALYTGERINTEDALPERIQHVYWCAEGFFPELLTEFVFDLYAPYPHRAITTEAIRAMGQVGRPSAILRLDAQFVDVGDSYVLPPGMMAGSMQLVPSTTSGRNYLVGTVYTEARTELWILDAGDLARGPIARLASERFDLGFSLHTAFLPALQSAKPSYRITARAELAEHARPALRASFAEHLYPHFE